MKKMFYIAAAAVVAMTGCTQIENEVPQEEISFKAQSVSTKALINPAGTKDQVAFPAKETFGVYATATEDPTAPLMNFVTIANKNGVWKAETGTYLWPTTGTASFYAYYPAGAATFDDAKAIQFKGMNLGKVLGSQVDPMVATSANLDVNNTKTVALLFKHVSSQIQISLKDVTGNKNLRGLINVKSISIDNVYTKGDYSDEDINGNTAGKGAWTNQAEKTNFSITSTSQPVDTILQYVNKTSLADEFDGTGAIVVVPGILADDVCINVEYSVQSFTVNGFTYQAQPNGKATINLKDIVNYGQFQCGVRYIFNIEFSLDGVNKEITFSPMVEGWTNEEHALSIDVAENYNDNGTLK